MGTERRAELKIIVDDHPDGGYVATSPQFPGVEQVGLTSWLALRFFIEHNVNGSGSPEIRWGVMGTERPKRIQLRRTKGWRKPEGAIVVARPSRWGNPFRADVWGLDRSIDLFRNSAHGIWNPSAIDRGEPDALFDRAYALHRAWTDRLDRHPLETIRSELRGHDLACWCPLEDEHGNRVPCHADVLLELANS